MKKLMIILSLLSLAGTTASAQNQLKTLKMTASQHQVGTYYEFNYFVTAAADKSDAAVYVFLEGNIHKDNTIARVMDSLAVAGVIPGGIVLNVFSGTLHPTSSDGQKRKMRGVEFDTNSSDFPHVIVDEMIPLAVADAGITISSDPDKHLIFGSSSGGYLAWICAWYRNDFFHRVYLSSPTFSNVRGGHEDTFMMRKVEPRPIRVFMSSGTSEPDYYFGDSFYAACNAASALKYARYDFRYDMYAHAGHGARRFDYDVLVEMFKWQFAQKTVTAAPGSLSFRMIVPEGSVWEETSVAVPAKQTTLTKGDNHYFIKKGRLYHKLKGCVTLVDGLEAVEAIAFSSDMWRLYVADRDRRFLYAYTLDSLGVPGGQFKQAPIELPYDFRTAGCTDVCVSSEDRSFVATEYGVQCIRSFGVCDFIIPLPGDVPALRVWLSDGYLYAASADKVYRRLINAQPHDGKTVCCPSSAIYGDHDYSRPHFDEYLTEDITFTN